MNDRIAKEIVVAILEKYGLGYRSVKVDDVTGDEKAIGKRYMMSFIPTEPATGIPPSQMAAITEQLPEGIAMLQVTPRVAIWGKGKRPDPVTNKIHYPSPIVAPDNPDWF